MGKKTERLIQIVTITIGVIFLISIIGGVAWRSQVIDHRHSKELGDQSYGQFIASYPGGKKVYCVTWFTHASFNEIQVFCVN